MAATPRNMSASVRQAERYMRAALEAATLGLAAGEPPIGACLVQDGEILAAGHNQVVGGPDATAHAEIVVIREACRRLRAPSVADAELFCTVEPCPMCLAACHYAGIRRVHFGLGLEELARITGSEIGGWRPPGLTLVGGLLAAECRDLLARWAPRG